MWGRRLSPVAHIQPLRLIVNRHQLILSLIAFQLLRLSPAFAYVEEVEGMVYDIEDAADEEQNQSFIDEVEESEVEQGDDGDAPPIDPVYFGGAFEAALQPLICPKCPTYTRAESFALSNRGDGCKEKVQATFNHESSWDRLSAAGRFHQLQLAFDQILPEMKKAGTRVASVFANPLTGPGDHGFDPRLRPMMSCMMYHESAQPHAAAGGKYVGFHPLALNYTRCQVATKAKRYVPGKRKRRGHYVTVWKKPTNSSANGLGQVVRKTFVGTFDEWTSEAWVKRFLDETRYDGVKQSGDSIRDAVLDALDDEEEQNDGSSAFTKSSSIVSEQTLRDLFNMMPKDVELQISASLAAMAFHKASPGRGSWYTGLRTYGPGNGTYPRQIFSCAACLTDQKIIDLYTKQRTGKRLSASEETKLLFCLQKAKGVGITSLDTVAASTLYQFSSSSIAKKKSSKKRSSRGKSTSSRKRRR